MSPLWGLPWPFWGAICLGMAGLWSLSWPKERAGQAGTARYFVVRWFQAFTWILLAAAAFSAGAAGWAGIAPALALAGLGFYLVFLTVLNLKR